MAGATDILSQDEIDALLHGVDDGDVETEAEVDAKDGVAREFDFENQDRIVRGRLPTLEMINERFARYLRIALFNMLRRTAEISVNGIEMIKYAEYIHKLFVPTSLSMIKIKPLRGTGAVMLDPKLVFILVDNFFGGEGAFHTKIEGREFTPTELSVIRNLVEICFEQLIEAWLPVMDLEFSYTGHEVNPHLANIVSPSEVIVISSFHIELDGGGGDMHFIMPYSMIEPIRSTLDAGIQSDRGDIDDRWIHSMRDQLMFAEVNLNSILTTTVLSVGELVNLQPGDIIPVTIPEEVTVYASEDIPVLRGKYGVSNGNAAIKVTEVIALDETDEYKVQALDSKS